MQVVKHDVNRFTKRSAVGQQVSPFAGKQRVRNIEQSVDGEEPHEEEVPRHALREPEPQIQSTVEPVWKEMEPGDVAPIHPIDVVGPVDEKSAPDHSGQQRGIDPVKPPHRARMFCFELFHRQGPPREEQSGEIGGTACSNTTEIPGRRGHFSPPILSLPILPDPILSDPILPEPILSEPILSESILSEPILSEPILSLLIFSVSILPELIFSLPVVEESQPAIPRPTKPIKPAHNKLRTRRDIICSISKGTVSRTELEHRQDRASGSVLNSVLPNPLVG